MLEAQEIERVGLVGCGLMGSGIAEVCARAGLAVSVTELDEEALNRGRHRIEQSLKRAAKAGKIDEDEAIALVEGMSFSTDLGTLADCQLVVEAVVEAEAAKVDVFRLLDRVVA